MVEVGVDARLIQVFETEYELQQSRTVASNPGTNATKSTGIEFFCLLGGTRSASGVAFVFVVVIVADGEYHS